MNAVAWTPEHVAAFQKVCDCDPFGPLQTPGELLQGSYLYQYKNREQGALVALSREVNSGGIRVHVQAMVSTTPGKLQTRQLIAAIEATAKNLGADVLSFCTPHRQIIDGAKRWGGNVTGAIITKILKVQ